MQYHTRQYILVSRSPGPSVSTFLSLSLASPPPSLSLSLSLSKTAEPSLTQIAEVCNVYQVPNYICSASYHLFYFFLPFLLVFLLAPFQWEVAKRLPLFSP